MLQERNVNILYSKNVSDMPPSFFFKWIKYEVDMIGVQTPEDIYVCSFSYLFLKYVHIQLHDILLYLK